MQNLQVGLGAVLALDTSAFLARQPPPRQPETTRHDGITPSNTPPSIRHPTHRLLWDAPENRASGPPSTAGKDRDPARSTAKATLGLPPRRSRVRSSIKGVSSTAVTWPDGPTAS